MLLMMLLVTQILSQTVMNLDIGMNVTSYICRRRNLPERLRYFRWSPYWCIYIYIYIYLQKKEGKE
jgi:hypothetical protein